MVVECETGFHFRRRGDRLVLAMNDPRRAGIRDRCRRIGVRRPRRAARRSLPARGRHGDRRRAGGPLRHDPRRASELGRVADGVYAACGFAGHGFMQSPAVGRALGEEILDGASSFDLAAFRLERFAGELAFPRRSCSDTFALAPGARPEVPDAIRPCGVM